MTIVPLSSAAKPGAGFRLAANRDEARARAAALPPEVRRFGSFDGILPIDPVSGGTWVAVNTAGVAMTLLNVYPGDSPGEGAGVPTFRRPSSRGGIIPSLLGAGTARAAADLARRIDVPLYSPFRLVVLDTEETFEILSDGRALRLTTVGRTDSPALFTSSGLGDDRVHGPRRQLFDEMIAGARDLSAAQDAYHRHSWPGREHVSVCMRRGEAATVSHTIVEVTSRGVRLDYRAGPPDATSWTLARTLSRDVHAPDTAS